MKQAIKLYVIIASFVSSAIAIAIIGFALYYPFVKDNPELIPEFVQSWGGVIVGFYFGSFLTLLTKFVEVEYRVQEPAPPPPLSSGADGKPAAPAGG